MARDYIGESRLIITDTGASGLRLQRRFPFPIQGIAAKTIIPGKADETGIGLIGYINNGAGYFNMSFKRPTMEQVSYGDIESTVFVKLFLKACIYLPYCFNDGLSI